MDKGIYLNFNTEATRKLKEQREVEDAKERAEYRKQVEKRIREGCTVKGELAYVPDQNGKMYEVKLETLIEHEMKYYDKITDDLNNNQITFKPSRS